MGLVGPQQPTALHDLLPPGAVALVQGMGWGRGTVFAFWNIAHNVGGGITGVVAEWST